MRSLDFSSWQGLLSTLVGLCLVTLVMVGVRLVVMQRVQQRRERENRQINERLRTLIAAYKTLGGSFTGSLAVDPAHRRDRREGPGGDPGEPDDPGTGGAGEAPGAERRRRVRDAVEAALSDVILLGTEAQVRLAVAAATDMAAGRPVETAALVVSLRDFIRTVLDLDAVPAGLVVPAQGPLRPSAGGGRGPNRAEGRDAKGGGRGGQGQAGGGAGMGMAMGDPTQGGAGAHDPTDR
jgi:hypothetical protein